MKSKNSVAFNVKCLLSTTVHHVRQVMPWLARQRRLVFHHHHHPTTTMFDNSSLGWHVNAGLSFTITTFNNDHLFSRISTRQTHSMAINRKDHFLRGNMNACYLLPPTTAGTSTPACLSPSPHSTTATCLLCSWCSQVLLAAFCCSWHSQVTSAGCLLVCFFLWISTTY